MIVQIFENVYYNLNDSFPAYFDSKNTLPILEGYKKIKYIGNGKLKRKLNIENCQFYLFPINIYNENGKPSLQECQDGIEVNLNYNELGIEYCILIKLNPKLSKDIIFIS